MGRSEPATRSYDFNALDLYSMSCVVKFVIYYAGFSVQALKHILSPGQCLSGKMPDVEEKSDLQEFF